MFDKTRAQVGSPSPDQGHPIKLERRRLRLQWHLGSALEAMLQAAHLHMEPMSAKSKLHARDDHATVEIQVRIVAQSNNGLWLQHMPHVEASI